MNPVIVWHWCFTFFPSWKGTTVSSSACRIRTGQDICLILRDRQTFWGFEILQILKRYSLIGIQDIGLVGTCTGGLCNELHDHVIYVWRINSDMGLNTKKIRFLKQVLRERWSLRHVKRCRTESWDYYLNTAVRPHFCVNTRQFH